MKNNGKIAENQAKIMEKRWTITNSAEKSWKMLNRENQGKIMENDRNMRKIKEKSLKD